ncbi:16S rRNA (cytosine(967)-C(5))-methyltransferase RsmB [Roseateles sp. DAIF2]|uniref:16S rRNA (cytosine(967)-C(5))-methyltransferase RsmB n=1 Tax=Roseateles sp. DAIF2 TaxID=2714952 RepID=UPI0018A2C9D5|nr:16S rRNA (cytosine(967)-C(5))-methyltransferase RsmB [Roseateles sp. DAIF2]QPF75901.1 16S rRNA (cytosine(967)-C(5))-methyltransferase RsmB [Roseateles sp. DAIF2]
MSAPTSPIVSPPLSRLLLQVADAVQAVRDGKSLTDVLARCPAELRPGTQALSFHVLRLLGGAQAARAVLAPKNPPPRVDSLLTSALALLWPGAGEPPYAEHTVVDQAVEAARQRAPASAGFVNAVLRRFLREREATVRAAERDPQGAYNHPPWWIERVRQDWPTQWQAVLRANNEHPPMTLRVNQRQGTVAAYQERLAALGIVARPVGPLAPQALVLERAVPVTALPGFAQGAVSVQDAAAQLAAPLLLDERQDLPPLPQGARVLDACAAPGGKTAHLLEQRGDLELLALDADAGRLTRVQDNLNRLALQAGLKAADARDTAAWWDGRPFDAILLDAPCSASGIVRRHPDVRWLRRPGDIGALAQIQAQLLDALWPLLKPGGRLVYATCSIFKAEGQAQVDAFLQRQSEARPLPLQGFTGHLLPLTDNGPKVGEGAAVVDGFFYALLRKN